MCGIAGAVAGEVDGLFLEAARRGPHSWGLATPTLTVGGAGRFTSEIPIPPGRPILAHFRLATDGWMNRRQPIARGGLWLAHNGCVRGASTKHEIDSYEILDSLHRAEGSLEDRVRLMLGFLVGLERYGLRSDRLAGGGPRGARTADSTSGSRRGAVGRSRVVTSCRIHTWVDVDRNQSRPL